MSSYSGGGLKRELLAADRTYYVLTTGSDSNTGLVNSSGGAFLTIQKALDTVASIDLSIYNVTIQVGNGTYTGLNVLSGPWVGSGKVTVLGDATTPSNAVISTAGIGFALSNGARLSVSGLKGTTSSLQCFSVDTKSVLTIEGNMEFGTCSSVHLLAQNNGLIRGGSAFTGYTISGGAARHWQATSQGTVFFGGSTITITGTPAFSSQFALAQRLGYLQATGITFSGSATGTRYLSDLNSVIYTNGGGASYLPGDVAGSATNGGQYS